MSLLRVVLDTNVVLSTLLFRSGRLSQLRHDWQAAKWTPVACSQTMGELARVLGYKKFGLSPTDIAKALALYVPYIETHTLNLSASYTTQVPQCRDPKDQIFLDLAHSAKVNCLVTGDEDLLVLDDPKQQHISFRITTPMMFLAELSASSAKR